MIQIRLIIFSTLLCSAIKTGIACGPFYPSNEAIRFHMIDPGIYEVPGFNLFAYSGHAVELYREEPSFVLSQDSLQTFRYQNVELWMNRCHHQCDQKDVYAAVYVLNGEFKKQSSQNSFVKYLIDHNDTTALYYLSFADDCEVLNDGYYDPWERRSEYSEPSLMRNILHAWKMAQTINDDEIKQRYAFQAVRLAFYGEEKGLVLKIFDEFFKNSEDKNLFYYWSLSFAGLFEEDPARRNINAAMIFKNAADKRYMAYWDYKKSVPLSTTLAAAKNNEERAAVYMMDAMKNPGRSLTSLRKVYQLDPRGSSLTFILLREINKLEYWIYTPYFQYYNAAFTRENWWRPDDVSNSLLEKRVTSDRQYAEHVLAFVNSVQVEKTGDPAAWRMAKVYLQIMTQDFAGAENTIRISQKKLKSYSPKWEQLEFLRAYAVVGLQENGSAHLSGSIQPVVKRQAQKNNVSFIFGLARMLEFKGNTTEAALLMSKLNESPDEWDDEDRIYWRTMKRHHTLYFDYYDDYFFYLDAQYTTGQLNNLIYAATHLKYQDDFSEWLYSDVIMDLDRLNDLLGTKYIRKNDLIHALKSFEQVEDSFYLTSNFPFAEYLDANPFYSDFGSGHRPTKADTIVYDKGEITKQLITYLNKANDTTRSDRDYYYFLVANCYFNMTFYGNSWMMRRYYWTRTANTTGLSDDQEYFNCDLAIQYYMKAKSVSRSKQFSALCLRMAGKCKSRSLDWKEGDKWRRSNYKYDQRSNQQLFKENTYYTQLRNKYPKYYDDLISNCYSFDRYFAAR